MNKQELDTKIADVQSSNDSPEEKQRRISLLNQTFENLQTQKFVAAEQTQQSAESNLKTRLKQSYMKNPEATEESFESDYPAMRAEYLRAETLGHDAAARAAQSRRIMEAF